MSYALEDEDEELDELDDEELEEDDELLSLNRAIRKRACQ